MYAKKEKMKSVVLVVLYSKIISMMMQSKVIHNKYNKFVLGNAAQKIEVNK